MPRRRYVIQWLVLLLILSQFANPLMADDKPLTDKQKQDLSEKYERNHQQLIDDYHSKDTNLRKAAEDFMVENMKNNPSALRNEEREAPFITNHEERARSKALVKRARDALSHAPKPDHHVTWLEVKIALLQELKRTEGFRKSVETADALLSSFSPKEMAELRNLSAEIKQIDLAAANVPEVERAKFAERRASLWRKIVDKYIEKLSQNAAFIVNVTPEKNRLNSQPVLNDLLRTPVKSWNDISFAAFDVNHGGQYYSITVLGAGDLEIFPINRGLKITASLSLEAALPTNSILPNKTKVQDSSLRAETFLPRVTWRMSDPANSYSILDAVELDDDIAAGLARLFKQIPRKEFEATIPPTEMEALQKVQSMRTNR